jgi:hypothetical protein
MYVCMCVSYVSLWKRFLPYFNKIFKVFENKNARV